MKKRKSIYHSNYKTITIKTVDGTTLQGKVNVAMEGRVSDLFTNMSKPFVVITDASYQGANGKTLVINKTHIVWVEPED